MTTKAFVGTVEAFNPKGSYGFLTVSDLGMDTVFFHLDKQVEFYDGETEPVGRKPDEKRIPKKGDRIFFKLTANKGRPRADPWGFADSWDEIWMQIESRKLGTAA